MHELKLKLGESLMIGDNIQVKVLGTGRGYMQVQLGVEAPRDIPVHREEIYEIIQNEKADY